MRRAPLFIAVLLLALAGAGPRLTAQDAATRDAFAQAKALWATQGDRDGAATKMEQVLQVLEPRSASLDSEGLRMLCDAYNWLAVLDDRNPELRPRTVKHLEAILALDPSFELDRSITPGRVQNQFETLRGTRCGRIKLGLQPEGGALHINGKPIVLGPLRHLTAGKHRIRYAKPGYRPFEQELELAVRELRTLDISLERVSSTVTFTTSPSGVEVLLDGVTVGRTTSAALGDPRQPGPAVSTPEDTSEPFILQDLKPGRHLLELRAPCRRSRRIELGEDLTQPFADHHLESVKLEAAQGTLTVTSAWKGGELFLSATSRGPLPIQGLPVCAGGYDLVVRFPTGGFAQPIVVRDQEHLSLEVRPKPRIAFAGLEGTEDFPGKSRLLGHFADLASRLTEAAWILPAPGESAAEALNRIQTVKDAELILRAVPFQDRGAYQVELVLSTLTGEEERIHLKPLEQDPLGNLVTRLNRTLPLQEPWIGLVLLDVPGEVGPWVLQADAAALQAGIQPGAAIQAVEGTPVGSVADVRAALARAGGRQVTVAQGTITASLDLRQAPREVPTNAAALSYPFLLAELRLRALGASKEELPALRLNQALALMHFRAHDKALEILRDLTLPNSSGLGQGTVDFYAGLCLGRLGSVYTAEASQTLTRAQAPSESTFFGPGGPLVAPLARQAAEAFKP